ncbi:MAG: sucrose-6-phosphate hydrolase [Micrococcaceae bacterium]
MKKITKLKNDRYRPSYHVTAPTGWINDPNGFCYFKGYYHIFYQYHPDSPEWGPMHWGHARSKDLVHWENLPIALTPGNPEDKDGCFSGSAIVKDDVLYLVYTGHHYYGDSDENHFWQNQNLAYSTDGITFTKYENNPIIANPPEDSTHHFRDPKVWKYQDCYYLVLGSQEKDGLGCVLMYKSKDLKKWSYMGPLAKAKDLAGEGFMWECPDFFRLDSKDILLISPQGIKAKAESYRNLYQTGYFIGNYNYESNLFKYDKFQELDSGHDFYAIQTTQAPDGRRLAFAWLNMWESQMLEQTDGWAGMLTLPRELSLKDNNIYMKPVAELKELRTKELVRESFAVNSVSKLISNLKYAEIELNFDIVDFDGKFKLLFKSVTGKEVLTLSYVFGRQNNLILENSYRIGKRYAKVKSSDKISLQIFIDASSIEIFINDGEVVFSERYFEESELKVALSSNKDISGQVVAYELQTNAMTFPEHP